MISSIHIEGFRGFKQFSMGDLGRVNLLVGTNNSGKTSLLEALYLLMRRAEPWGLWQLLWRRGERSVERSSRLDRLQPEVDATHLFTGHDFYVGSRFSLSAKNKTQESRISFKVVELNEKVRDEFRRTGRRTPKLGLRIEGHPNPAINLIPIGNTGKITADSLDIPRHIPQRAHKRLSDEELRVQYVTTDSMDGDYLVTLWNGIALTPDEDLVLSALSDLDPDIERIAAQVGSVGYRGGDVANRSGFMIKHKRYENPIPMGTMGDGIWRLFSLAIAITQCRGGVLLVDEIDTGLHHTAMSNMWKLVIPSAIRLNVQVFATTHSYDCVTSLASSASEYLTDLDASQVTLQRIERDQDHATSYTAEEIQLASKHSIEVR